MLELGCASREIPGRFSFGGSNIMGTCWDCGAWGDMLWMFCGECFANHSAGLCESVRCWACELVQGQVRGNAPCLGV